MKNLRGFWILVQIVRWVVLLACLVYLCDTFDTWASLARQITIAHFALIALTTCIATLFKHGKEVIRHKKTVWAFFMLAFVNLPYLLLTEEVNTPLALQIATSAILFCLNTYLNSAIAKYWYTWWDRQ
jgi:hypothetical protein